MAITCPVDLDTLKASAEIRSIYARVATDPSQEFHFHRGAAYAAEMLGYDATALASFPPATTASFAGVANPHRLAAIPSGATVVDIGCGAGMDLLLAARAVGPRGRAIGIDMTESMAARPRRRANEWNRERRGASRRCVGAAGGIRVCRCGHLERRAESHA